MPFVITLFLSAPFFLLLPQHHPLLALLYHLGNSFSALQLPSPIPSILKLEYVKFSSFLSYPPQFKLILGNIHVHALISIEMQRTQRFISLTLISHLLFLTHLLSNTSKLSSTTSRASHTLFPPTHALKLLLSCILFNECYYNLFSCETGAYELSFLLFFSHTTTPRIPLL